MIKSDSLFRIFKSRTEFDEWIYDIDPSIRTGLVDDVKYPILIELPLNDMRVIPANDLMIIAYLLADLSDELKKGAESEPVGASEES